MDIIVQIVDGVAEIYQPLPPGTYKIDVIKLPGYEKKLYDEDMNITSSITIEANKMVNEFYIEATGEAALIIQEELADGSVQELLDEKTEGIVIRRTNTTGTITGNSITMSKNGEVFPNLPYSYNQEKGYADGPDVSLIIDRNTLPMNYVIKGNEIITKKLEQQQAEQNKFIFLIIYTVRQIWYVFDRKAPIYSTIDDEGKPLGYLMIGSGTLLLDRIE